MMTKRSVDAVRRWRPWRVLGWGTAVLILLLPLVAMQFTNEVDWGGEDFLFAAILLGITGLSAEGVVRLSLNDFTRVAAGLALGGGLLLIWINAAVGIIGSEDNPANTMYLAVLATGLVGALIARFRSSGMVAVMATMAVVQAGVTVIAVVGRLGLPYSPPLELLAINGFFIALWLASASLSLTLVVAVIGGAALSFGVAAASLIPGRERSLVILGGAAGGLIVGGAVKLLGLDAFELLLGQSPGDITGAAEGIVLGAAAGCGAWMGWRQPERFGTRRHLASTALVGLSAGLIIPLLGGRLMAGSLDLLANSLPQTRLRLDALGLVAGENHFGPVSQVIVSGLEGALFVTCIVAGMALAHRQLGLLPESGGCKHLALEKTDVQSSQQQSREIGM